MLFPGTRPSTLYRPVNKNVVGCRWIYKNKFSPYGSSRRCKSHLVAKGYNQQYGRDYTDTFNPVIKATTIRLILDIVVSRNWPIQQLDVNNAFLQGTLDEEDYMEQPPGFIDHDHPDYVCRLRRAIYGLKQAPRVWYLELKTFLLSLGFKNSLADTSMFVLQLGGEVVYLLVYVDEFLSQVTVLRKSTMFSSFLLIASLSRTLKHLGIFLELRLIAHPKDFTYASESTSRKFFIVMI